MQCSTSSRKILLHDFFREPCFCSPPSDAFLTKSSSLWRLPLFPEKSCCMIFFGSLALRCRLALLAKTLRRAGKHILLYQISVKCQVIFPSIPKYFLPFPKRRVRSAAALLPCARRGRTFSIRRGRVLPAAARSARRREDGGALSLEKNALCNSSPKGRRVCCPVRKGKRQIFKNPLQILDESEKTWYNSA